MSAEDVSQILESIGEGEPAAAEELLPILYDELRKLAAQKLARERAGQTLQPTALVHEAYLRLSSATEVAWENRAHFLGIAARAMRQILVEHARARSAAKRGGGLRRVTLDSKLGIDGGADVDAPQTLVELEDELPVGRVMSAVAVEGLGLRVGLGYLPEDFQAAGTRLQLEDGAGVAVVAWG